MLFGNYLGQVLADRSYDRTGSLGLDTGHHREPVDETKFLKFHESLIDGRNVAGIPHREHEPVRDIPQLVKRLKPDGFLSLETVRVDGVEEVEAVGETEIVDHLEGTVEVAPDRDDLCPMHEGLCYFPHCHLSGRQQDNRRDARFCCIDRKACRSIAGACAGHALLPQLDCHRDTDGHAPVLERAGGVHSLVLGIQVLKAHLFTQTLEVVQRGAPFL